MSSDNELLRKIDNARKAIRESHTQYHSYRNAGNLAEAAKMSRYITNCQTMISLLKRDLTIKTVDAPEDNI